MTKSLKPTGHFWTCASHFQRSVKYREIRTEDFATPFGRALVPGADDDLTKSERSAKRRRIETLADGFLNGRPLHIASASANGLELRDVVNAVLRSEELEWDAIGDEGKDIRDEGGVQTPSKPCKSSRRAVGRGAGVGAHASVDFDSQPKNAATANRPRVQHPLSTTPSVEALAHAARLRARKLRSTAPTVGTPTRRTTSGVALRDSNDVDCDGLSDAVRQPLSQLNNVPMPTDNSLADELRLSYPDTPSRKVTRVVAGKLTPRKHQTAEDDHSPGQHDLFSSKDPPDSASSKTYMCPKDMTAGDLPPATASDMGSTAMSMCTAFRGSTGLERGGMCPSTVPSASNNSRNAASTNVFQALSVEGPRTWTPINAPDAGNPTLVPDAAQEPSELRPTEDLPVRRIERAASASLDHDAGTDRQRDVARAAEGASRAKPKRGESSLLRSFKQAKPGYQSAPLSQGGTTPLMYKKRGRPRKAPPRDDSEQMNRPDACEGNVVDVSPRPSAAALSTVHPPLLDMSFGDDSFAPRLNMALVDEHLNKKLPRTPDERKQGLSLKSALRAQMRDSGATIERASSELPSSQLDTQEDVESRDVVTDQISLNACGARQGDRRSTALWPGTQVLLNQAQHDLFTSPDKSDAIAEPGAGNGPQAITEPCTLGGAFGAAPLTKNHEHHTPIGLPATQTLMDDWQGWSTVKHSEPTKAPTSAASPLLTKAGLQGTRSRARKTRSSLGVELQQTDCTGRSELNRSSAKTSTASTGSFAPLTTSGLRVSMTDSELLADTTVRVASTAPPTTSVTATSNESQNHGFDVQGVSFASTDAGPYNKEGAGSAALHFSSFVRADESQDMNAETTLADLAKSYLSTADVDLAMSQV